MQKLLNFSMEADAPDEVDENADDTPDATDVDPAADEASNKDADSGEDNPEPIALPDEEYSVDKLADLVQDHDMKVARQQEVLHENHYVAATVGELAKALEELNLYGENVLPAIVANPTVRGGVRLVNRNVALEAFSARDAAKSIIETIRSLIKRVLAAISSAIDWVIQTLRDTTSIDRLTVNTVKRATDTFVAGRKADERKIAQALHDGKIDPSKYVDMQHYKLWLTIDGKEISPEPRALTREFSRILAILRAQNYLTSVEAMDFADVLTITAQRAKSGERIPEVTKTFDPTKMLSEQFVEYSHYDNYTPEKDRRLLVAGPLLGTMSVHHEFPRHGQATQELTALNQIALWKYWFSNSTVNLPNTQMRLLATEEVIGAQRIVVQIGEELERRRRSLQNYQRTVERLRAVVREVSAVLESAQTAEPLQLYTYSKIIQAANSVIKNGMVAVEQSGAYARKVMVAWGNYVAATSVQDVKTANTAG